jgi:hypothetical protein
MKYSSSCFYLLGFCKQRLGIFLVWILKIRFVISRFSVRIASDHFLSCNNRILILKDPFNSSNLYILYLTPKNFDFKSSFLEFELPDL